MENKLIQKLSHFAQGQSVGEGWRQGSNWGLSVYGAKKISHSSLLCCLWWAPRSPASVLLFKGTLLGMTWQQKSFQQILLIYSKHISIYGLVEMGKLFNRYLKIAERNWQRETFEAGLQNTGKSDIEVNLRTAKERKLLNDTGCPSKHHCWAGEGEQVTLLWEESIWGTQWWITEDWGDKDFVQLFRS